jgi:hypothetical protein
MIVETINLFVGGWPVVDEIESERTKLFEVRFSLATKLIIFTFFNNILVYVFFKEIIKTCKILQRFLYLG